MFIRHLTFDIETTGLDPINSRITCICAKTPEGEEFKFCNCEEKETIKDFLKLFDLYDIVSLVSANGKDFDIPFILDRAYILGLDFKPKVEEITNKPHFDVVNDICSKKISLNNLAKLYGFPVKTGNGLEAIKLWNEKKIDKLVNYCANDVRLTEKVYLRYLENSKKLVQEAKDESSY